MSFLKLFKWRKRSELERKGPASKKRRNGDTATQVIRRPVMGRVLPSLVVLLTWLVCAFTILYRAPQNTLDLVRGQRSPTSVVAQVDFSYIDEAETQEARQREAQKVLDYYRLDTTRKEQSLQAFQRLFDFLQQESEGPPPAGGSDTLAAVLDNLGERERAVLIAIFRDADNQRTFLETLNDYLQNGVVQADKEWITDRTERIIVVDQHNRKPLDQSKQGVSTSDLLTPEAAAAKALDSVIGNRGRIDGIDLRGLNLAAALAPLVKPNLAFDADLRRVAREQAMERVQPEMRLVNKGTVFIARGSTVSEQDINKLKAHALMIESSRDLMLEMKQDIKLLVISLLLLLIAAIYVRHQHPELVARKLSLIMLGTVGSLQLLIVWATEEAMHFFQAGIPVFVYPALPLTLAPLLLALLVGKKAGLSAAILLPPLIIVVGDKPSEVLVLAIVTSLVGVIAIYKSRTRVQTFRAALWILLAGYLVEAAYLLHNGLPWHHFLYVLGVLAASAFLTILLVNLLLPLCEFLFRLTTNISLLELSDLNHPLLKRLQLEAPGTYHHTLMVATLAEHGAQAVGANTLLTRVAAYFHDIGKLANPSYFTENSFGQNRHEELSPRMSSMVILNHVKEGLAMAAKYKLKEPIREAIATHHGTSLVYYFYRRALDSNQINDAADEENFRYPGPAPQSREASIISLADSCEAASRSLEKPTPQKIDAQVEEIFHNKLLNGQLDHSQLTMAELKIVVETIKKTLHTMLHGRVAYPKFSDTEPGEQAKKTAARKPRSADEGTETVDEPRRPQPEAGGGSTDASDRAASIRGGDTIIIEPGTYDNPDRKEADRLH